MSNRLVMGPLPGGGFGIRVARPGANVLDANLPGRQIAMDSNWLGAARIFMMGTTNELSNNNTQTVMFGETFPEAPPVIAMQYTSGNTWQGVTDFLTRSTTVSSSDASGVNAGLALGNAPARMDVRRDRVIFRGFSGSTPRIRVSYIILRP